MGTFLIVDSNTAYAEKLYEALTDNSGRAANNVVDPTKEDDLSVLSEKIARRVNRKTIVLINAEAVCSGRLRQHQALVDVALWLRTRHKLENVLVFYSLQSINELLRAKPYNFIILSPGCCHLRLPINKEQLKRISEVKALRTFDAIRPYLRPRLNLERTRHRYANYAGMAFMLEVAKKVWDIEFDNRILKGVTENFSQFFAFRQSLNYAFLSSYFDIEKDLKLSSDQKAHLKIDKRIFASTRLLLIDDLAASGWGSIVSQMVYGKPSDIRIAAMNIRTTLQNSRSVFDIKENKRALESNIKAHKPHLVLLDLRLNDEEGEKSLEERGGYQLLTHLKAHESFKGVPVIMFTASSKTETSKKLMAAGAEAIWTKPGIDEALSANRVIERYSELLKLVQDVISPDYELLRQIDDNTNPRFDINRVDFAAIRNLLFSKLEFIKYRLQLFSDDELLKLTPAPYSTVDAIYIDSNVLMTGGARISFGDIISAVYKLAILTCKSNCKFIVRRAPAGVGPQPILRFPKVVIMNSIFDEVIKKAKTEDYRIVTEYRTRTNNLLFMRAALSQLIIKEMFGNSLVRTEFDRNKDFPTPKLKSPKESVYADGYLLDEIADLTVTHASTALSYEATTKVLVVTGDGKLGDKLIKFSQRQSVIIKSREDLLRDMSKVMT